MPIIGYPMDHSNAAQVYNKLFEIYGLNKIMFPIEIKPEELGDFVKAAKTLHIDTYTLTMPLKSAIIPYLDEVDPCSRVFRSVNIVKTVNGKTIGAGMDGKGCVGALLSAGASIEGSTAVLLGAGSISGAIIYELIQHKVGRVILLNRNPRPRRGRGPDHGGKLGPEGGGFSRHPRKPGRRLRRRRPFHPVLSPRHVRLPSGSLLPGFPGKNEKDLHRPWTAR